jgi:hypothetical protein
LWRGATAESLGPLQVRFTLRAFYDGRRAHEPDDTIFQIVNEALRTDRSCQRRDCGQPIAIERQLSALRNRVESKWCSRFCAQKEAGRRYRLRHQTLHESDGSLLCQRSKCARPIPAGRQVIGLIRKSPAKYCSRLCRQAEADRRFRARQKNKQP